MRVLVCVMAAFLVAGCGSKPPAPVLDRSEDPAARALDSQGNYRVRRGDTLYAIAFRFGLDPRDIARWNGIRPPYVIYPDQALRMTPPPAAPSGSRTAGAGTVSQPAPLEKPAARTAPQTPPAGQAAGPVAERPSSPSPASAKSAASDPGAWLWPARGRVLRGFLPGDPSRNGLDIAGREGQDIIAAAGGTVVYSGNGLIGYGELIIVKHSDRMLSAYAHNRVRLVTEGATVAAGQKIAEMGRNDRNERLLHFEIREEGRPVNPLNYLPRQ